MARILSGAVLAGIVGAALLLAGSSAAAERVRVAILPIVVHSNEAPSYLRDGLADMLAARLGRSPDVAVIRIEDPTQATTREDAARTAGTSVSADYVLYGSFTRFGEGASLDLRCVGANGGASAPPRSIFIHSGTLGEIIPRLDQVADKVVKHVTGVSGNGTPPVSAAPTNGAFQPAAPPAEDLAEALAEIQSLRERVDQLERDLYGSGDAPVDEADAAAAPPVAEELDAAAETAGDLR